MIIGSIGLQPAAAYFYSLHLDAPSLAWNFLRRNTEYRRHWQACEVSLSVRWCLQQLLCPELPAGIASPIWRAEQYQSSR